MNTFKYIVLVELQESELPKEVKLVSQELDDNLRWVVELSGDQEIIESYLSTITEFRPWK